MPSEQDVKVANRFAVRCAKMANIAVNVKTIATERQRIEEVVDAIDDAARSMGFWKKGSKPVLLDPPMRVDRPFAESLLLRVADLALESVGFTDYGKLQSYLEIIRLAFLADEYLRNWKAER